MATRKLHDKPLEMFQATERGRYAARVQLQLSPRLPRQVFADALKFQLMAYSLTGEVAYLWEAYRIARVGGVPVPALVLQYLDACSDAVLSGTTNAKIMQAMRLSNRKGGAAVSKRMQAARRQVSILAALLAEYRKVGSTVASKLEARRNVARAFHTSEGRVHQLEIKTGL